MKYRHKQNGSIVDAIQVWEDGRLTTNRGEMAINPLAYLYNDPHINPPILQCAHWQEFQEMYERVNEPAPELETVSFSAVGGVPQITIQITVKAQGEMDLERLIAKAIKTVERETTPLPAQRREETVFREPQTPPRFMRD